MKKLFKNVAALALAGTMVMGLNVPVLAEGPTGYKQNDNSKFTEANSVEGAISDTATIYLLKDFDKVNGGTSTDGIFTFQITPYGVWNAGSSTGLPSGDAYNKGNMPKFVSGTGISGSGNGNVYTTSVIATDNNVDQSSGCQVDLPTGDNGYKSVGDFWYTVQESKVTAAATETTPAYNAITGVIYGTNDSVTTENTATDNNAHTATYYLHVQVTNGSTAGQYIRTVTLHKTAPGSTNTSNVTYNTWAANNYANTETSTVKVNDIQNKYYAGELDITKKVTGNAGDHDKRFKVTVEFVKPVNTIINSDIIIENGHDTGTSTTPVADWKVLGQDDTNTGWKTAAGGSTKLNATDRCVGYATVDIWIKADETVKFKNIPYGVTYTVKEAVPLPVADNTYSNEMKFTAESKDVECKFDALTLVADNDSGTMGNGYTGDYFNNKATGSISDEMDVVVITNEKTVTIDIGVITSNAPYIAMLVLAGVALVVLVRRKNHFEE